MSLVSAKPDVKSSTSICHALPCNVSFSGAAPVDVYFRPVDIEPVSTVNDVKTLATENQNKYQCAAFRGRGLIAVQNTNNAPPIEGRLLEVVRTTSTGNTNSHSSSVTTTHDDERMTLREVDRFTHITEWYHEHNVQDFENAIQNKPEEYNRVQSALDWIDIASALHAPVPFPDE